MPREPQLHRRIRIALELARSRDHGPRAIYLCPADRQELDRLATRRNGVASHQLGFDGVPITVREFDGTPVRDGKRSRVIGRTGTLVCIPKRPSPHT